MNRFIWRTYLLKTNYETTELNNYLESLHREFNMRYLDMQEEKRTIVRRKLLSNHVLDEIASEVSKAKEMKT